MSRAELDELFAVVLTDPNDKWRRVRWNPTTGAWFAVEARLIEPVPATPHERDVEAAVALARTIIGETCERCWLRAPLAHAIVPDVRGDGLMRVCMYLPDLLVVGSPIEGFRRKHDATSDCHLIAGAATPGHEAIYARGVRFTSVLAVQQNWCVACVGRARRTHATIRAVIEGLLGRPPTDGEVATIEADRRERFLLSHLRRVAADFLAGNGTDPVEALYLRRDRTPEPQIADLVRARHGSAE